MKSLALCLLLALSQITLAIDQQNFIEGNVEQLSQFIAMVEKHFKQEYGEATRLFTSSYDVFGRETIHTKEKHYQIQDDKLIMKKNTYCSQFGQDKYVHKHFFKNTQNGVFVDIGAQNGIKFSNSYFFEKNLGWTGICVEPIPNIFQALQKNRNCICLNCCITDFEGKATFIKITNSSMLSGLEEKFDPRHLNHFHISPNQMEKIIVDCFTPHTIFSQYGIDHIDFLSIDTEGGEFDIIKAIDFSKIHVEVITIEVNYKNDHRIYNYLTSYGYQYITRLGADEVYKRINTN